MIPIYKQKELRTELYKNEVTVCRLLAITYKFKQTVYLATTR